MSTWKVACGAALLAAGLASPAAADEFTKLTLLTFSGPVDVPGITLPAGTYRFSLADPESGRRVVKVADKDGSKTLGMFISVPNQRLTPTDKPVVMFKEAAAGAPPAIQAWFYPGESYGYEFAYPHDQALKIARATHQPVLSYTDRGAASSTDDARVASMKSSAVTRIDENDKPVSSDEALKQSSEPRTASAPRTTTAPARPGAQSSTGETPRPGASVGTSGSSAAAPVRPTTAARPLRQHLPSTASDLPLFALIASLALAAGIGLRLTRKRI
jgi:hypothetical protein